MVMTKRLKEIISHKLNFTLLVTPTFWPAAPGHSAAHVHALLWSLTDHACAGFPFPYVVDEAHELGPRPPWLMITWDMQQR